MVEIGATSAGSDGSHAVDSHDLEPHSVDSESPERESTQWQDDDVITPDDAEVEALHSSTDAAQRDPDVVDLDSEVTEAAREDPLYDLPKPPDGGWGWMCVLGQSINFVVITLLTRAFGVTYLQLLKHYDCSPAAAAWVGAINISCMGLFGPVATALSVRFTCRSVTIAGNLVCFVGVALTAIAPNIYVCFLTYGIIAGFGTALIIPPGYFIINEYFDKWKATAMGLSIVGAGLSMLAAPPLLLFLFTHYGHQWGLLIIAALCLHGCIGGALYRPLEENSRVHKVGKTADHTKRTRPVKKMTLNVKLLSDIRFLSYVILMLTLSFCTSVLSGLVPALAVENNISLSDASLILALNGVGDLVGATLFGFILDLECLRGRRVYWISGCNVAIAICVSTNPIFHSVLAFILLAVGRSMFVAHVISQRLTVLGGIVPRNQIHGALGFLLLGQAVGSLAGRGMGGVLKSTLGSYSYVFYITGVLQVVASFSTCLTYFISKRRGQRRASMASVGSVALSTPNILT